MTTSFLHMTLMEQLYQPQQVQQPIPISRWPYPGSKAKRYSHYTARPHTLSLRPIVLNEDQVVKVKSLEQRFSICC